MRLWEYIFYRVARHWYKQDGRDAFRAIMVIAAMQGFFLADLLLLVQLFTPFILADYVENGRHLGYLVAIILFIPNYFYFKGKYWMFADRWRDTETPTQRRVRGWLVVFAVFFPFILYFSIFIIFGEYGWEKQE